MSSHFRPAESVTMGLTRSFSLNFTETRWKTRTASACLMAAVHQTSGSALPTLALGFGGRWCGQTRSPGSLTLRATCRLRPGSFQPAPRSTCTATKPTQALRLLLNKTCLHARQGRSKTRLGITLDRAKAASNARDAATPFFNVSSSKNVRFLIIL